MRIQIPTTLSEESNRKFRKLYKNAYGLELTIDQANDEAFRAMTFLAIVIENTDEYYE